MVLDYGEVEGYRSVYAQAVIQLRKDLSLPVQQFFVSQYGAGNPIPHDWHIVIASHLAALERDRHGIDASLLVPDLPSVVRLWLRGCLPGFGMMGREPRDAFQREVNAAIELRIESIYGQGDAFLTAICVTEFPQMLRHLTRNAGLRVEMAEEVADRIIAECGPIAEEAWRVFAEQTAPASVSMFRPPKTLNPSGHRQYFR